MQYGWLLLAPVAACAQAGQGQPQGQIDAPVIALVDAKLDSPVTGGEAGTDSPGPCTNMTVNLLQNANFDTLPEATGWTETRIQNEPIVRADGTITAQSGTERAWLGGVAASAATDSLTQDIVVPASATNIGFTGYYDVRTGETGTTVYDSAKVELLTTGGTVLESIKSFSNAAPTTAWTAFNKTFTSNVAGMTVRLRLTSTNDIINATSFYFDTFAVNATVCQ